MERGYYRENFEKWNFSAKGEILFWKHFWQISMEILVENFRESREILFSCGNPNCIVTLDPCLIRAKRALWLLIPPGTLFGMHEGKPTQAFPNSPPPPNIHCYQKYKEKIKKYNKTFSIITAKNCSLDFVTYLLYCNKILLLRTGSGYDWKGRCKEEG